MNATTYAVDLASQVFQVHGYDRQGMRVSKRRLSRGRFRGWCDSVPAGTLVVMEATGSAHHWGRVLQAREVRVKLMPPQHVAAMLIGNKTDANDADAIFETSLRPKVRPVPVKTAEQQAILAEHRRREGLIRNRTRTINQLRALLREFGIVLVTRDGPFRRQIPQVLEDAGNGLPWRLRTLLAEVFEDLVQLDVQIAKIDRRLEELARQDPLCQRLQAIEGIGPISATALRATLGQDRRFARSRQFAASLGLVPSEHSSGQQRRLGSITKRGNGYLRYLLVHGARSVVRTVGNKTDPRSRWIQALQARVGFKRAVVALANKNARIVWALFQSGTPYRPARA
ncbi:MAG TPA: IS110 family transposase [Rhodanobacteraceae bacterium]|nr:IS110 family transposase [Rhodanobacteraceae bacterium]